MQRNKRDCLATIAVVSVLLLLALSVLWLEYGAVTSPTTDLLSTPTVADGEHFNAAADGAWRLERYDPSMWQTIFARDNLEGPANETGLERPPAFVLNDSSRWFPHIPLSKVLKQEGRLLATENTFNSPGIIGFDKQTQTNYEYYAYQYIFTNLNMYSSQLVIYPYNFIYQPNDTVPITEFAKGAVFSVRPELLPFNPAQYNYFSTLLASTDVKFGKAKALYDINVAVLKVEDYYDDMLKELTYESTNYCNILSSYMGKYKDCLTGTTYLQFRADIKNQGKTALVMMDNEDLTTKNLLFTPDGDLRFKLLIIPDFYLGAHSLITKKLGTSGLQKLRDYATKGGMVFATGKAGFLLEEWGILPKSLYDTKSLLTAQGSMTIDIAGCDPLEQDFVKRLLCMNLGDANGKVSSYLLSAYPMQAKNAETLTVIQNYSQTFTNVVKTSLDGSVIPLTEEDKAFMPFAAYATYGKGKVFLINGNPLFKGNYNKVFYNYLLLAMSKNVMLDAYVGNKDNKPIPGGEAGTRLDVKISYVNLYSVPTTDVSIHLWTNNNIQVVSVPAICVPDASVVPQANMSLVNASSHLRCGQDLVDAFERVDVLLSVEIMDHIVTQQKYDILLVSPIVNYTDKESGITFTYDAGGIRTDAALAAYLSGGLNVEPSSFYPILGRGNYVDNLFGVENKEDTLGLNVDYVAVVPLISPVVDGSDQRAVSTAIRFFDKYYTGRTNPYYFPFRKEEGKNYDYLDYKWLSGKGIILDADWDIPVKAAKMIRNSSFPDVPGDVQLNLRNGNWSTVVTSVNTVVKQIYYVDSDRFFEHATQRLLAFVDTSTEEGARTLYPDGIPADEKNPNRPTRAKKELIWVRNDIFFYSSKEYVFPTDINDTHVLSVDRYPPSDEPCVEIFGDSRSKIMVAGYFGNEYPGGLKPNEYSNEMLQYCHKKKVTLAEIAALSNNTVLPIHYLVPVVEPLIERADDIMYFVANEDGSGYLEGYPELKFVYAHRFSMLTVKGQGGRFDLQLPEGVRFKNEATSDPVTSSLITFSSGVAFYKTVYDKTKGLISAYYRCGGMVSNVSLETVVEMTFEELTTTSNFQIQADVYEMKYDISLKETQFERYIFRVKRSAEAVRERFYSLPAMEIHNKLLRRGETAIMPYEGIGKFSQIGLYIQELQKHRTVYASTESHHVRDPGLQSANTLLASISNLGVCSIPFATFVTHGAGLLIPFAPSTSRIEWDDIWGRRWVNPLRSLFPDIPPIPPPLLNFGMVTTFELTKVGSTERVLEWNSDEELDIRVHIKLHNTYPKYFLITACKDNEVAYFQERPTMFEKLRVYETPNPTYDFQISPTDAPNNSYHINFGQRSVYGMCFDAPGTILKGGLVSDTDRARIATAHHCADTLDPAKLLECAEALADLPTVNMRPDGDTHDVWMFAPDVDKYYPKYYIKADMWDMTHELYEDNPMDKGFKYHLDNGLPGIDFGPPQNPATLKPHNIISFPVWKGFGFTIHYDKNRSVKRFSQYKGWWSDNLQNKDHTLYAGQSTVNDISVDKSTLLPDSMWISARNLINPKTSEVIKKRVQNFHACMFNQHRIKMQVNQTIGAYPANVYQNNIIPILTELTEFDKRYTNFDCSKVYQYSPYNISQFDSIVRTNIIRDSMLFAANLRGGAYETINIVMGMKPLPNVKYEGLAKVQDGGAFSYWNPVNGPNSFVVTGSSLNVVEAKRTDLTIDCEVFPKTTATFNPELYHLITLQDPAEILREWKYITYTNNYGFGDTTTAVYVGGVQATKATLQPGDYTIIKITFYNNAGFEWNLLYGSVEADLVGFQALNAGDLLKRAKHTIQKPTKYNFMTLNVSEALKNYVTIVPSDHNLDLSPQFFDFLSINLATIGDAGASDFFYRLTLAPSLPDNLRGKVHEIGVILNEGFFDALPGYNDPTKAGYHDYRLKIPSIKFAIPYASGPYQGKAFYTSAYATELEVKATLPNYWNATEAKLITDAQVTSLRQAAGNPDNYVPLLRDLWASLEPTGVIVNSTVSGSNRVVSLNFSTSYPTFPKPNGNDPDIAAFSVLLRANTSQLPYGTVKVLSSPTVYFKDFTAKKKSGVIPAPLDKTVSVKGAWIQVSYSSKIVKLDDKKEYVDAPDQRLFLADKKCIVRVKLTAKNVGTDTAYNVNFTTVLAEGVTLLTDQLPAGYSYLLTPADKETTLKLNTQRSFAPGASSTETIYLIYEAVSGTRRRLLASGTPLTFIKGVSAQIDLTGSTGAIQVSQTINTPLTFTLITDRDSVTLNGVAQNADTFPKLKLTATPNPTTTPSGKNIRYIFYQSASSLECTSDPTDPAGSCSIFKTQEEILQSLSETATVDVEPIPASFKGTLQKATFAYRVETYSETKLLLASNSWAFNYVKATPSNQNNNNGGSSQPTPKNEDPAPTPAQPSQPSQPPQPSQPSQPTSNDSNNSNSSNSTMPELVAGQLTVPSLPLWAIILIPLCVLVVLTAATCFIMRRYRRLKVHSAGESQEVPIQVSAQVNDPEPEPDASP